MSAHHPVSDTQLRALLAGSLPEDEAARLEAILETDRELRERLEILAGAPEFDSEIAPGAAVKADEETDPDDLSSIISSLKADSGSLSPSPTPSLIANILGPPHEPDSIGSLGPYEVEGHLATGGMGVVYKARDPKLKRQVAIKVLSPHFAGHDESMQRFLREATAAAAIEHPNVLPIHAIDTESAELPFLVLRYVDGPSVEKLIAERRGPLELEQVFAIAKAVSSALAAAHAKDLTHRDIKPSNILLEGVHGDPSGESQSIYLTDFGLARIADESALTRPGTFLGTPQFSAPEQARGDRCDHRSDLFSLGAVLYTMATGAPPFSGEDNTLTSVVYRVVHENHPPAQGVNPALPAWFSGLIDRLLEKDPDRRPQSAGEVLRCLETESLEPLRKQPRRRKPKEAFLIAALLIALLVASLLFVNPFRGTDTTDAPPPAPGSPPSALTTTDVTLIQRDGSRSTFTDLAEALAAATDGSILEIAHDGELVIPPLIFPSEKTLTLRAAPGHLPVLSTADPNKPVLTSSSNLVLEGLTFRGESGTRQVPPVIKILAGTFTASGCRLEVPSSIRPRERSFALHPPLMEISGTPRFQLENCEFIGAGSGGIRYLGTTEIDQPSIEIRNCLLVTYSGLELHGGSSGDKSVEVTLDRNFFVCRRVLVFFGAGKTFPVKISVSESLFSSDTTIVDTLLRVRDLFENVTWTGRNNVYSSPLHLAHATDRPGRQVPRSLNTMLQFKTLFGTDIEGSIKHDLAYRKYVGQYLLEPTRIKASLLKEVPPPAPPLPTTGPDLDLIGPGEPYHKWRAGN